MRFAVTLHLSRLDQCFIAGAGFGPLASDRAAVELGGLKHFGVAKVAVVGDGQQLPVGFLFILRHPLPEVLRVLADETREGDHLVGLVRCIAIHHNPVQVVAAGIGRPLIADEGGETSRLIVLLGGGVIFLPDRLGQPLVGQHVGHGRALADHFEDGVVRDHSGVPARLEMLVPFPYGFIGHDRGQPIQDRGHGAHVLSVISNHQKVQRSTQLTAHTG